MLIINPSIAMFLFAVVPSLTGALALDFADKANFTVYRLDDPNAVCIDGRPATINVWINPAPR